MKNYKYLTGKTAKVFIEENRVRLEIGNEKTVVFTARADNFDFQFNTELLGGEYSYAGGKVEKINQRPAPFQNGNEYEIQDCYFYDDVQGETRIKYERGDCFCSLFLALKTFDQKFCDITLESDTITVVEK